MMTSGRLLVLFSVWFPIYFLMGIEYLVPQVITVYPHARDAFTQGLVICGNEVYESTGLYGSSSLRWLDLEKGGIKAEVRLPPHLFGEGLAWIDNQFIQLTWKEQLALVYDASSLHLKQILPIPGEGWGLCAIGKTLLISNGSSTLYQRAFPSWALLNTIQVHIQGKAVTSINALAFAKGEVYANLWGKEKIIRINIKTGAVTGIIDASALLSPQMKASLKPDEVLNGIAFWEARDSFLITGKNWPFLFEVKFAAA